MKTSRIDIKKCLDRANKTEKYTSILVKYVSGARGEDIANDFLRMSTEQLYTKHQIPKPPIGWKRRDVVRNILQYALEKNELKYRPDRAVFRDYTKLNSTEAVYDNMVKKKQSSGELRMVKSLNKLEQKALNKRIGWEIKHDASGNPLIKTDKEGKLLYDIKSNTPIYKYTPKSTSPGFALRMHLLEEHKMKKWDNRHPKPVENSKDVKEDLFPQELFAAKVAQHRTMRYIHLESVRDFLAVKYCNSKRVVMRPFKVYEVYKTNNSEAPICEVERWSDAYYLAGLSKDTSNGVLADKLNAHLKAVTSHPMGDKTIGYKVYDSDGNFRLQVNIAA